MNLFDLNCTVNFAIVNVIANTKPVSTVPETLVSVVMMECRSEWHTRSPHSHSPSWTEIFQWICLHKDSVGRNGKSQQWIVNGFEGIWYSYNGVHWYESIGWCYIAFTVCLMLYWNRNCELTHYLTGSLFPFCPSRILYFNKPALMYIKFQSVNLVFFCW